MDVQTYFFRRTNMNALGQPRSAGPTTCCGTTPRTRSTCSPTRAAPGAAGGEHRRRQCAAGADPSALGIAMDMSIQLKSSTGAICTLSLSFNNDGPLGTFFRYIGDSGTYIARYDDLIDAKDNKIDVSKVDVSMNGIELQDREFFAAIREGREPNASVAQVLPCYRTLHGLEQQLVASA
jgi:2-hydroxy-4-carboxymuconate semialdehyde hemiacetal dehydrogenase